ncbi:MFS transporter [Actinophytocola xanthii]|uniref:MFS transporter n=1 Tax=Actinophytocola xanthii TaxID=1912961 RepID=A0A1Q8CTX8_9PSEU|nr:MFS transporter [Actinophytocola xanthii]OLF17815.1 MFS transporter [Actinophytocola xanthii]
MTASPPTGYRGIFRSTEYRGLFAAQTVSMIGDQFARVALAVLVFDRTGSPAWTALTYGLTFLPDLVGGPLLSGLADRYPRRGLIISCDVLRALLVALMAVPGTHLAALCVLLVAVQLISAPANAARGALLPSVLGEADYPAGQAALQSVTQAAQVIGFAAGGALVATIGTSGVLLADAATFLTSALLVARLVRHRPAATEDGDDASKATRAWLPDLMDGSRLVLTDARLRALVLFACVSGFYIVGEALAVPYAAALGNGAIAVGFMFAGYAAGAAVGALVVARLPAPTRLRLMPPLSVAACAPLVLCFADPALGVVVALFVASGLGSAYNVVASTTFVLTVPDSRRGQAFGLAVTALKVSQGLGVMLAGLAAEHIAPHQVVGLAGVLGVLAAAAVAHTWRAADGPRFALAAQPA